MRTYSRINYIQQDSSLKKNLLSLFDKKKQINILDIGGCEGEETVRYSRLFPLAKIYIFEPLPKNLERIRENVEKYQLKNVQIYPFAVSNARGNATFYVSSGHPNHIPQDVDWDFGNKSSSLLFPLNENNPKWLEFKTKINVNTITLDSFFMEAQVKLVDFIHMDVQGAEMQVLEGAKNNLKNIKAIWLEVSDIELYKGQPLRSEIEEFMDLNNFYLSKSKMEGNVGDQLYVNKKFYKVFNLFAKSIILKKSIASS